MPTPPRDRSPLPIFGHRGAPGSVPQNTLGSYALAARMGADAIEFDLVCSKDGVLVDRHEPNLIYSTDVADRPEFADRWRVVDVDGVREEGWFTVDFTFEELRTLRAGEPFPELRPHTMDVEGEWRIPSLDQILDLRARVSAERGWGLGVYIEIKHSSLFHALGFDPEVEVLAALDRAGLGLDHPLVRIESFEQSNLRRLRGELGYRGELVFLAREGRPLDLALAGDPRTYADLLTPAALADIAEVVQVIGPSKHLVIGRTAQNRLAAPSSLVADAHAHGLAVMPWTFRAENHFLPADFRSSADPADLGDYAAELAAYFDAGIDGAFCDQPDLAIAAREAYLGRR